MATFVALELSYDLIGAVRAPLARISAVDAALADQLRRAAQSVALNLAEGSGRAGRDRSRFFRTADGSHREARACLQVALRLGYLAPADVAPAEGIAQRLGGMLFRLAR